MMWRIGLGKRAGMKRNGALKVPMPCCGGRGIIIIQQLWPVKAIVDSGK